MKTSELVGIAQEHSPALTALACFFAALNEEGIRYCHWKSNIRLVESLQGRTDLDLLVDPEHQSAFEALLHKWDMKLAKVAPGRTYPGLEHYLGFDAVSGRMFHLHVHYQLVLGEQFVKNYHLPLENHFLDTTRLCYGVKLPAPELELTILALRALLKYRDRDALKGLLPGRPPAFPAHIRQEIAWLVKQTSAEKMSATLESLAGILPVQEVRTFLDSLSGGTRAGWTLWRLRGQVRQALQPYQRDGRSVARRRYRLESWRRRKWLVRPQSQRKMTLADGGVQLAFVGVDGAGKSTVVDQIGRWLSWRLTVRTHYMGHSRPSTGTWLAQALAKNMQRLAAATGRIFKSTSPITRQMQTWQQTGQAWRYVAEARDRYQRYRTGSQEAHDGLIVIYDRYPLPNVYVLDHVMDGARLNRDDGQTPASLTQPLARREDNFYRQIKPPDCLFVLQISPEVAQQRKPEHKWHLLEAKSQALANLVYQETSVIHIQAEQSVEQVMLEVKRALWRLL